MTQKFKYIYDWAARDLICFNCGTTKSVKYEFENNYYCNACITFVVNHKLNNKKRDL